MNYSNNKPGFLSPLPQRAASLLGVLDSIGCGGFCSTYELTL
jgi:hypothetical protein